MIDAPEPEIEFINPFDAQAPDEDANLTALTRSLRLANGFGLIFAVCNQSDLRERLMRELASRLPEKNILQVPFREPIDSLYHSLREILETSDAETPLDAVFVYGLESWLPAHGDEPGARFISNLNLFRNNFPNVLSCPLVLWIPQHILAEIQDRAPDFVSVRSGVYIFAMTSETRSNLLTSYISEELTAIASLTLEEKHERIKTLERLLKEYQSLSDDRRNLLDEAPLMTSLAFTYKELGRFDRAEVLLEESLNIYRAHLPANHPNITAQLNNMGTLYSDQERYKEAEDFFREALALEQAAPPSQRKMSLLTLSNLANVYNGMGRYDEARLLLEEALSIFRSGASASPNVMANILTALANSNSSTGHFKRAEELYKEALSLQRKALPPKHPDTAASLNNLAETYIKQGKYSAAAPLLLEALQSVEAIFGPEHSDTLHVVNNCVAHFALQGQYEQARDIIIRFPASLANIPMPVLYDIMQATAQ